MHFRQWKRREVMALLGGAVAWPPVPRREKTNGEYRAKHHQQGIFPWPAIQ
jgi:hypothetical protein